MSAEPHVGWCELVPDPQKSGHYRWQLKLGGPPEAARLRELHQQFLEQRPRTEYGLYDDDLDEMLKLLGALLAR